MFQKNLESQHQEKQQLNKLSYHPRLHVTTELCSNVIVICSGSETEMLVYHVNVERILRFCLLVSMEDLVMNERDNDMIKQELLETSKPMY